MSELPVGVIGIGGMGAHHVDNLAHRIPGTTVAAVMDPDGDRLAQLSEKYRATAHTDALELIHDRGVEAVVIASPDSTHSELTLACIEAGKPVLCEKPLATDLTDARNVVEAEAATDARLVQVGFMRHFDPEHVAVKEALDRGEVGRPIFFRGWHRNLAVPPNPSTEDVLISSAIHDLYSARWIMEAEVAEISVQGSSIDPDRSTELELQIISMRMDNETLAVIEVNRDSGYGYEVGVEVVGSAGTLTTARQRTPTVHGLPGTTGQAERDWIERFAKAYLIEATAWADAARHGQATGPAAWDGYATLVAARAGVTAIEDGHQTVELGPKPSFY